LEDSLKHLTKRGNALSYKNQEIWILARELSIKIHKMMLQDLPKFEMFEVGGQIRRSIKSVRSAIVEGYGRRQYHADYIRFLTIALASNDETIDHLETLHETGSLSDKLLFTSLHERCELLGKKLSLFIQAVAKAGPDRTQAISSATSAVSRQPATSHQKPVTSNG
jgi:four helix bundle protein